MEELRALAAAAQVDEELSLVDARLLLAEKQVPLPLVLSPLTLNISNFVFILLPMT